MCIMPDVFFLFLFPQFFSKSNYFIQIWWNVSLWALPLFNSWYVWVASASRVGEPRLGTARHGTVRHGTARHGTARHGSARHGSARHGSARVHLLLARHQCSRLLRVYVACAHAQPSERAVKQSFCVACREWTCQSYNKNKQMNERTHARTNEWTNVQTNKWMNERTNERTDKRVILQKFVRQDNWYS